MVTFTQLKKLEFDTIQTIRTQGAFGKLWSLQAAAQKAQIIKASNGIVNVHLSFTLPTRLREDGARKSIDRPFHVGCFATPSGDEITQLSYSVLIGKEAFPSTAVARKFHFDFEPVANRNIAESKPSYHLQMCGELSQHHRVAGYVENDIAPLLPAWSQPRIPSLPMSLALVLNWLFIEFGHESAVKDARLNPQWRKLVRDAERIVLKPYYEECSRFLGDEENIDQSFFARHLYSES